MKCVRGSRGASQPARRWRRARGRMSMTPRACAQAPASRTAASRLENGKADRPTIGRSSRETRPPAQGAGSSSMRSCAANKRAPGSPSAIGRAEDSPVALRTCVPRLPASPYTVAHGFDHLAWPPRLLDQPLDEAVAHGGIQTSRDGLVRDEDPQQVAGNDPAPRRAGRCCRPPTARAARGRGGRADERSFVAGAEGLAGIYWRRTAGYARAWGEGGKPLGAGLAAGCRTIIT